jgi:hypothetical protein
MFRRVPALPALEAYIWFCGDDECDCTQPVVERIDPNPQAPGFIKRTLLWEGTFCCQAGRTERAAQVRELRAAARRHGINLDRRSLSGFAHLTV